MTRLIKKNHFKTQNKLDDLNGVNVLHDCVRGRGTHSETKGNKRHIFEYWHPTLFLVFTLRSSIPAADLTHTCVFNMTPNRLNAQ